jgi:hypothetical protein
MGLAGAESIRIPDSAVQLPGIRSNRKGRACAVRI